MQAGDQSEQIFTRWRAGAYNARSLPWALFYRSRRVALGGAFGDACRLGSPQAVALLLGDLRVKATQHLAESINAAPDHASLLPSVVCLFDRSDGRGIMLIF